MKGERALKKRQWSMVLKWDEKWDKICSCLLEDFDGAGLG